MADWDTVRALARELPGAEEGASYGTPALKVGKQMFARLREDGHNLVLRVGELDRDALIAAEPEVCHITPHYLGSPMVLVRLPAVEPDLLRELLLMAWRFTAPARLLAAYDAQAQGRSAG